MQKAVNDVIDIFTSEDMENVTGYFPYSKTYKNI